MSPRAWKLPACLSFSTSRKQTMTRLENTSAARPRTCLPVCLLAINPQLNPELLMRLSISLLARPTPRNGNGRRLDGVVGKVWQYLSECLLLDFGGGSWSKSWLVHLPIRQLESARVVANVCLGGRQYCFLHSWSHLVFYHVPYVRLLLKYQKDEAKRKPRGL